MQLAAQQARRPPMCTRRLSVLAGALPGKSKRIFLLRHGQAMHNPRAEAAKDRGCSHEKFLSLMQEDDCFDAPLTQLGRDQAHEARLSTAARAAASHIDLVVASPLSRALETADLVFPVSAQRYTWLQWDAGGL